MQIEHLVCTELEQVVDTLGDTDRYRLAIEQNWQMIQSLAIAGKAVQSVDLYNRIINSLFALGYKAGYTDARD